MTEEQIALARRAVACKGWRWMPGMRALPCSPHDSGLRGIPVRVVHVYDGDGIVVWGEVPGAHIGSWEEWRWREEGRLPDLTDPATWGCLLALVREAWATPAASVIRNGVASGVFMTKVTLTVEGSNLDTDTFYSAIFAYGGTGVGTPPTSRAGGVGEALVAALEAPP